jgi:hypothetical protein
MKLSYLIILVIVFLTPNILHTGFCGTIDPGTPDTKYIEYGKKFTYVLGLCGKYQDDSLFCASCVAIDDHHILTAAHVVKDYKECYITVSPDKKYQVNNIISHKDFEKDFGVADIAIGYVKESMGLEYYPTLYETDDEEGKVCCMSGFGLTGTFLNGATISDNKRRAGSNKIDYIDRNLLICTPSKKGQEGYTSLEFLIASGDSGGGLFIDGKLAGINSCVMTTGKTIRSKYGEESGHTRVSKFVQWIKDHRTK